MPERQIPYLFEDAAIYQPLIPLSENEPNIGKTRVRVFYKYANRNHSFITDGVAEQIINSAPTKPVVGFFNKRDNDYTSHMGAEIASAYGFICENPNFAWEKHLDNDGVEREYACFDVILHTEYFEEANQIVGNPQSMELNENTISGDWGLIEEEPYFFYNNATLKALCVLGKNVEPCFESAAFFSKDNNSLFDKFSALLLDLQAKVKEIEKHTEGGDADMEDNKELEFSSEEPSTELEVYEQEQPDSAVEPEQQFEVVEEPAQEEEVSVEEPEQVEENNFSELENENAQLKNQISEYEADADAYKSVIAEKDTEIASLNKQIFSINEKLSLIENQLNDANSKIAEYESYKANLEVEKKEQLISSYANMLSAEEIDNVKTSINNFTYEELDANMAKMFAHKAMEKNNVQKIPHVQVDEFAEYMQKYKK